MPTRSINNSRREVMAGYDRRPPLEQGFDDGRVAAARRQVQRRVAPPVPGVYVHLRIGSRVTI